MPFSIVRSDIVNIKADCIVNAANTALQKGGGVCGAIFKAAGTQALQAACDALSPIQTGEAVITPGFGLSARHIIHTVGPVYRGGGQNEATALRACYENSLRLAVENKCRSVAFPLISTGIYGYPKEEALAIAKETVLSFLKDNELDVSLVVYDNEAFTHSKKLMGEVQSYIDEYYVKTHPGRRKRFIKGASSAPYDWRPKASAKSENISRGDLPHDVNKVPFPYPDNDEAYFYKTKASMGSDDALWQLDEPFSAMLLCLIDAKGKTDVEVYKKANLDRKLFSKIRTVKNYTPTKRTALALAVALELSHRETEELLARAGYALSPSRLFDVIVEFFIKSGRYNIFEINEVLFQHDQQLLGG